MQALETCMNRVRPDATRAAVRLEVRLPADGLLLEPDFSALLRIAPHVLRCAIGASPESRLLCVGLTRADDTMIRLEVAEPEDFARGDDGLCRDMALHGERAPAMVAKHLPELARIGGRLLDCRRVSDCVHFVLYLPNHAEDVR